MAFYLSKERDADVVGSYKRYLAYLNENRAKLPANAFELGTAMWYQDPHDHRCPHDGWLESLTISEPATGKRNEERRTTIGIRLLAAHHDGFIEFFYPRVFSYSLVSPSSVCGLGDWRYDEFRHSAAGNLIHEIEWAGTRRGENEPRWIIEASDVQFRWIPKSDR